MAYLPKAPASTLPVAEPSQSQRGAWRSQRWVFDFGALFSVFTCSVGSGDDGSAEAGVATIGAGPGGGRAADGTADGEGDGGAWRLIVSTGL